MYTLLEVDVFALKGQTKEGKTQQHKKQKKMAQEMLDILASLRIEAPSSYDDVPGSDCFNESIKLSIAPPLATNEYIHEKAFGFLFEEEMKLVRQLYQKYLQGKKFMMDLYCARNCARAFPPLPSDCDPTQTFRYYMSIYTSKSKCG
jgi:hypothetical protein